MEQTQLAVKLVLNAWENHIKRADLLFGMLSDEQLQREISPGKNTGVYLLGHLTAIHDALFDILGLGERSYTTLDNTFIKTPDKSGLEMPSVEFLRKYWLDVNVKLKEAFSKIQPSQWFERHMHVSDEDFQKEPHRNKLNVLISRTNHLAYHWGQLILLK